MWKRTLRVIEIRTSLVLTLIAVVLLAGCVGPLKDFGVENWTCEVSNVGGAIMNNESTMKTYTGGDCAALVQECRNRDLCRLVKTQGKQEYMLVGLDLDDPDVQKLIVDGPVSQQNTGAEGDRS